MLAILPQLLVSGILIGGVYALLSIGLTLIFGVLRIVNFAQGEFIMLAMFGAFWANVLLGIDPYLSAVAVVPAIFVLGMLVERFVIQRIMYAAHSMQIFATFGLSVVLQNLALTFWGPDFRSVTTSYTSQSYTVAGLSISATSLFAFIAAIVMAVGLIGFLHFTRGGRALRAMVQNRYAASLMGVDTKRLNRLAFGCGVACAAVCGCILTPMYYTFPTVGIDLIITAFVVVVLGGMGSMWGCVVGGLTLGLVENLGAAFISTGYKNVFGFIILILVLLVRPAGLFGRIKI